MLLQVAKVGFSSRIKVVTGRGRISSLLYRSDSASNHSQTYGKIEKHHLTVKNVVKLNNCYLPKPLVYPINFLLRIITIYATMNH